MIMFNTSWLQRMGFTTLALALGLALGSPTGAQESDETDAGEPVVIARSFTVPSAALGEDRPIQVALPEGYDSTKAYPVIYVLDGPGHLVHTVGSARFLASNDRMPASIVVAVGNTSGNRTRDLTPPLRESDPEYETAGGAENFQAFLRDDLKPWVESRYATRRHDILIGHSLGGLFIAHVLNAEPDLFDAYIAISPSLWWDDEHYVSTLDDLFERFPDHRGSLYMTMGNEGGAMISGAWHLAGTLEKEAPNTFRWKWEPMLTETHGSVPARSTYDGLEWIFSGWYPSDLIADLARDGASELDRLEKHFVELSEEMGWEVNPPEMAILDTSWQLGEDGRFEDALAVAERVADWSPESADARALIGEAYAGVCRWSEAKDHYLVAVEMVENDSSGLADFIRSRLEWVESSLAEGETCEEAG